ncbi:putative UPF0481 protein At3g02645 [Coffea arabica]|uniref:UPF0481 protein At3g02645 n=1 Tax=Coffea arabica TaxID=13443 RepID=A0A6P6X777_COFAR|nr:putative UPF0481 protein At3g02645 [Coffea arabica]
MAADFDEQRWVIQIRLSLEEELEEYNDLPVSIFSVPKTLMVSALDCFVPQVVALGPYHHWRSELYEMEKYKIASAKRTQKRLQSLKFQDVVDQLARFEPRIRACYHKYLDFNGETIAWMMAMDASFLLEFLQVYAAKEGKVLTRLSSRMSHLLDLAGTKSVHNAILRDMVMLENQIPLFLLREMLELQLSSLEEADNLLMSMLIGFGKELLPFKVMEELPKVEVTSYAHLLDFLYRVIVPELEGPSEITEIDEEGEIKEAEESYVGKPSQVKQLSHLVGKILSKLRISPELLIKRIFRSKPIKVILKLPWKFISKLPVLKLMKAPIENMCFSADKGGQKPENLNSTNIKKPPLVEEITIPSVTELSKAGVKFMPTNEGIFSINFDDKMATFRLPKICLDLNTEVVLRNLVAYEACNASGPLVFTRYTELLNGIIDTEEDAKFLREKGIILNHLKSDEEVAHLCNGMSKSVRLTTVPRLDKVIEDVNRYYNRRWQIKTSKFLKHYIFRSWQLLTLIAAIVLLSLTTLQAFCSVYSCSRVFRIDLDE